eukprot:TRINITY_DN60844_c0_g1_i1.p1 TRINITY_DN60844_c0_g1~~TRINITY_DN60844_c0_g1_i1.p1  ORF type:complete len:245 (+),score=41.97 TRINITY_DN60844_c0_g1_i1:55-789(+)
MDPHSSPAREVLAGLLNTWSDFSAPRGLAVLLATGSYNPAHVDHVSLMAQAKAKLESEGYSVVQALVSPSSDTYVRSKLGRGGMSGYWRMRILAAVVKDMGLDSWLQVDEWECQQKRFHDHPEVARSLHFYLEQHSNKEVLARVKLFYVAGGDLYNRCCHYGHADGVIVAGRQGESEEALMKVHEHNQQADTPHFFVNTVPYNPDVPHMSSTLVRKQAKVNPELTQGLLTPGAHAIYQEYLNSI